MKMRRRLGGRDAPIRRAVLFSGAGGPEDHDGPQHDGRRSHVPRLLDNHPRALQLGLRHVRSLGAGEAVNPEMIEAWKEGAGHHLTVGSYQHNLPT